MAVHLFQASSKTKIFLCSSQTLTCWMCECGLFPVTNRWEVSTTNTKWKLISIHACLFYRLISSHPALVNAIILVLHSVAGSMPTQSSGGSSRSVSASSYSEMPGEYQMVCVFFFCYNFMTNSIFCLAGGFMFEGMSDDDEDFQSVSHCLMHQIEWTRNSMRAWMFVHVSKCLYQGDSAGPPNRAGGSAGMRPVSLSHSGATGPRPITQSELATALALASTPDSSAVTPTTSSQVRLVFSPLNHSTFCSVTIVGIQIHSTLFHFGLLHKIQ